MLYVFARATFNNVTVPVKDAHTGVCLCAKPDFSRGVEPSSATSASRVTRQSINDSPALVHTGGQSLRRVDSGTAMDGLASAASRRYRPATTSGVFRNVPSNDSRPDVRSDRGRGDARQPQAAGNVR